MDRERLIEIFVGLIFIVFLILVVVVFLNINNNSIKKTSSNSETPKQTIINNYYENNYNSPEKSTTGNVVYKYPDYNYVVYKKGYDDYKPCCDYDWDDDEFSSYGKQRKVKNGLNYVDEYKVYVRNEDSVGKYFKVIFYFEDNSNLVETEVMIKYIDSRDDNEFIFRDSHFERYNYEKWNYDVFSQDDGFENEIFESNSRSTNFHNVPSISCR
jgi:hypothetical protein